MWVGGIILSLVPSAIQLGCVNSSVFRVENYTGKLVFWRDVLPKADIPVENIF
jgi:hypothetical protein